MNETENSKEIFDVSENPILRWEVEAKQEIKEEPMNEVFMEIKTEIEIEDWKPPDVSELNCRCMSRFDTSGTSKNDNSPKVLVGHGLKKYGIEICLLCLQPEIRLFVCILRKKSRWSKMVKMTFFQLNF